MIKVFVLDPNNKEAIESLNKMFESGWDIHPNAPPVAQIVSRSGGRIDTFESLGKVVYTLKK